MLLPADGNSVIDIEYKQNGRGDKMAYNPMAAYGTNKVTTATPAELTLMLYEGAIKFCNIAQMAMEKKDYEKANLNMQGA